MKTAGSQYVLDQRRSYSLYTINSRAIPAITDGLKPSGRRVLWMAKNGDKYKSATLAGLTMPIHPHDAPEDVINTLAAPYGNNIPLFHGIGAFGTMLKPKSFGASRYTSVKVSDFTKDVVFADIEIIPMIPNYDNTLEEPKHFLPLIPLALLNPTEGISVGFKCDILPRTLKEIVSAQISFLKNDKAVIKEVMPTFHPIENTAKSVFQDPKTGNTRYVFEGKFDKLSTNEIRVTHLPFKVTHAKFVEHLEKLSDSYAIGEYSDRSKNSIDIRVRFGRGILESLTDAEIIDMLGLSNTETEIMNVLDFAGEFVWNTTFSKVIPKFTEWRLQWYINRYERLLQLAKEEIQRYKDVLRAIEKNVGGVAKKTKYREELMDFLRMIDIVNVEYIANLPVYRFTEQEKEKTEAAIQVVLEKIKFYNLVLKDEQERKKIYIEELQGVLKKYGK